MDEVTFKIVRLLFIGWSMLLLAYAGFWRRRAGNAYYYSATQTLYDKEKKEFALRGVLAGNKDAARLYAIMQPDEFSSRHPYKIFKNKGVRCVFAHYYYPKRYEEYLDLKQSYACQDVLDFKDGQSDHVRFQCPDLINGISWVKYTGERQSLHLQKGRADIQMEKNYELTEDLEGKKIIVVDDLLTTGKSLKAFKEEVEKKGGKVIGAIFAAHTFEMPTRMEIFIHALLSYLGKKKKTP